MRSQRVAAVLTANAALSSILAMMLRECPDLNVRQFESASALSAYARIARVDILVCDYTLPGVSLSGLCAQLRRHAAPGPRSTRILVLTRHIDRSVQIEVMRAGIDEIAVKPVSPAYIKERVLAYLGETGAPARTAAASTRFRAGPDRRGGGAGDRRSAEIIQLFGSRPGPTPVIPRP